MKFFIYTIFVLLFLSGCGGSSGGDTPSTDTTTSTDTVSTPDTSTSDNTVIARTESVTPYAAVDGVTIASSYLKFKDTAPENEALVPYLQGTLDGEYVTDVIDGATISFDVNVPDDSSTYGSYAGKTVKYIGVLYYPTKFDSNYTSPQTVSSWEVPSVYSQMETTIDATPIFADTTKKYPLVVYSHGLGGEAINGGRNNYMLSSHDYVVLSLFHGDGRFEPYVTSPEQLTLRSLSLKTAIDFLLTSKYKDNIDFDKIGALGNSYGGTTSFVLAGAKPIDITSPTGQVLPNAVNDSRIKVAVGIEPFMGDDSGSFPEIFGKLVTIFGYDSLGASTVNTPYLAITGTSDTTAVEKYTISALSQTPSNAHVVSMEGQSHEMDKAGSDTAETWALYFLNYYLKADPTFLSMKDVSGDPVDTYISPY